MEGPAREPVAGPAPEDRRIALTARLLGVSFGLLAVAVIGGLLLTPDPVDVLIALLLVAVGAAAAVHVRALAAREGRRRADVESVARLLRGLARSVSPDAIVGAIAGELAPVADADHVVVIRVRGEPPRLDATLVSTRPGVPSATTQLPMSDLEDPGSEETGRRTLRAVPVGVEVEAAAALDLATVGGRISRASVSALAGDDGDPDRTGRSVDLIDGGGPGGRFEAAGARMLRPSPRRTDRDAARRDAARRDAAQRVAERLGERAAAVFGLRSTISAPLVVDGVATGALVLSRRTAIPWSETSRRRLDEAATEASVALDRARSYQAAETRASTDALTGLPNRRYFDEFCGLLARRRRSGDAIGVLMIDIDRFKLLNDRHGHAIGDEVLRAVGAALVATVRDDDVPARYGGEEFVVLLRNPTREVAVEIGERVRRAVAGLDLRGFGVARVTVSVGAAVQRSADQPVSGVVDAADRALYRAKRAGRDRVVAA